MNLTIIPLDGAVYIDGVCFQNLTLVDIPANVHALQWKNTKGWIEFVENNNTKPENEVIFELPQWAVATQQIWQDAKTAYDEAMKAIELSK